MKLTEFLRDNGILSKTATPDRLQPNGKIKKGSYKNLPNKNYEKYFNVTTIDTGAFSTTQTKVKASGVELIYNMLKEKK